MPNVPSLVEETGRTACGSLLLYKKEHEEEQQKQQKHHRQKTNKSSSPSSTIGNTNFLTTAAALEGSIPQYQQAENLILDAPVQFLSQIRSFVPPNFFAKKIHSTDFRILAAQCQAVRHSHPVELLALWIDNLCRNDISVNEMVKIVRETRIAKEKLRQENENKNENESENENEENSESESSHHSKQLADVTSGSALQVIQRAVSPLNACRAIFASLYCFVLQISASVWTALERAHREKEMERLSNRPPPPPSVTQQQQQQQKQSLALSGSTRSRSSGRATHSVQTSSKLPPLVGVRQRPCSSGSSPSSPHHTAVAATTNTSSSSSSRPETTICDTNFLRTSQFQLNHSRQKLGGVSRNQVKPIRTAFHKNIHDNIAAVKSDELRSHVPLVNPRSRDSAAAWELACLDFPDNDYPHLAELTRLQQEFGAELLETRFDDIVPLNVRREGEKELIELCCHVQQVIEEMFESSADFLAPAFTQCLVVLRGWFKNNNITNDFIAAASTNPNHNSRNSKSPPHHHTAEAATANLHEPASTAMTALLGVEPRVPGPYIVTIDGARSVHIPHPLSSHTILVANALRHQSQLKMEKQKHQLKLHRAKTDKILELQRAAMRPRNDPKPAKHVPGRSRRAELGLETEGDSSETLEKVLSTRFHSTTTSVLKKRKF